MEHGSNGIVPRCDRHTLGGECWLTRSHAGAVHGSGACGYCSVENHPLTAIDRSFTAAARPEVGRRGKEIFIDSKFDPAKSLVVQLKHGISLSDAQQIFDQTYLVDQKNDDRQQFRAIGWCQGRLCSAIFEVRHDEVREYYHLITAWNSTKEEEQNYAENT